MGRPKKKQTEMLYIRISKELRKFLQDEAEQNARDLSDHVRYLLENYARAK